MDKGEEFGYEGLGGLVEPSVGLLAVAAQEEVRLREAFGGEEEELVLGELVN